MIVTIIKRTTEVLMNIKGNSFVFGFSERNERATALLLVRGNFLLVASQTNVSYQTIIPTKHPARRRIGMAFGDTLIGLKGVFYL